MVRRHFRCWMSQSHDRPSGPSDGHVVARKSYARLPRPRSGSAKSMLRRRHSWACVGLGVDNGALAASRVSSVLKNEIPRADEQYERERKSSVSYVHFVGVPAGKVYQRAVHPCGSDYHCDCAGSHNHLCSLQKGIRN